MQSTAASERSCSKKPLSVSLTQVRPDRNSCSHQSLVQEGHEMALGLIQYMVDPRHTGNRNLPIRSSLPVFLEVFFFLFSFFFFLFSFFFFLFFFFLFSFFFLSSSLFRQSGILSCFSSSVELCVPYTPTWVESFLYLTP